MSVCVFVSSNEVGRRRMTHLPSTSKSLHFFRYIPRGVFLVIQMRFCPSWCDDLGPEAFTAGEMDGNGRLGVRCRIVGRRRGVSFLLSLRFSPPLSSTTDFEISLEFASRIALAGWIAFALPFPFEMFAFLVGLSASSLVSASESSRVRLTINDSNDFDEIQ
jgi:hypothetical protein